jgi:glyceraldehyde 3-phosphate dehydrogenase
VSRDVVGDPASCVIDGTLTQVAGRMATVFGWYDNEWATRTGWSTSPS